MAGCKQRAPLSFSTCRNTRTATASWNKPDGGYRARRSPATASTRTTRCVRGIRRQTKAERPAAVGVAGKSIRIRLLRIAPTATPDRGISPGGGHVEAWPGSRPHTGGDGPRWRVSEVGEATQTPPRRGCAPPGGGRAVGGNRGPAAAGMNPGSYSERVRMRRLPRKRTAGMSEAGSEGGLESRPAPSRAARQWAGKDRRPEAAHRCPARAGMNLKGATNATGFPSAPAHAGMNLGPPVEAGVGKRVPGGAGMNQAVSAGSPRRSRLPRTRGDAPYLPRPRPGGDRSTTPRRWG